MAQNFDLSLAMGFDYRYYEPSNMAVVRLRRRHEYFTLRNTDFAANQVFADVD